MADYITPNLGYVEPENGGSVNTWGVKLNENIGKQDTDIHARLLRSGDVMSGRFGVVAGTEAEPGVYISGDTDTGFYSPAPNNFGISTGGVGRFLLSNTLLSLSVGLMVSGSTALAGVTVSGNATFGDAAGDTLTINGTAVSIPNGLNFDSNTFVIDAVNNTVGIGTINPSAKLVVVGETNALAKVVVASGTGGVNPSLRLANGAAYDIQHISGGGVRFVQVDVGEHARFNAAGQFLVGTSSAVTADKLTTSDGITLGVSGTGGQVNYFGDVAGFYEFVNRQGVAKGFRWYTGALAASIGMTLSVDNNLLLDSTVGAGSRLQVSTPGTWFAIRSTTTANNYGTFQKTNGAALALLGGGGGAAISGGTADDFVIRSESNLLFAIGNTEAARTTSARFFKASNTGTYRSVGAAYHEFYSDQNTANLIVTCANTGNATEAFASYEPSGFLGNHFSGYVNESAVFRVINNGNLQNANNSYGALSDAKLKNILGPAPSYWEKYKLIEWVKYVLKNDPTNQEMLGVIAQQVQGIFPGLIESNPDMERVTKTRDVTVTRQVTVTKLEPATRAEVVLENGKWVQKVIEETVEVAEPQFDEYELFDERGNVVLQLVSPEVQAVEGRPAIISEEGTVIDLAIEAVEYQPAVYEPAKHKVPRMETVVLQEEYEEMVPTGTYTLSVKYSILGHIGDVVLQEAMARIEALEAA